MCLILRIICGRTLVLYNCLSVVPKTGLANLAGAAVGRRPTAEKGGRYLGRAIRRCACLTLKPVPASSSLKDTPHLSTRAPGLLLSPTAG